MQEAEAFRTYQALLNRKAVHNNAKTYKDIYSEYLSVRSANRSVFSLNLQEEAALQRPAGVIESVEGTVHVCTYDGMVHLRGKERESFRIFNSAVTGVAAVSEARAFSSADGRLALLRGKAGAVSKVAGRIERLAAHPHLPLLFLSEGEHLAVRDAFSEKTVLRLRPLDPQESISSLCIHGDGSLLFIGASRGRLVDLRSLTTPFTPGRKVCASLFHRDGVSLSFAEEGGALNTLDLRDMRRVRHIPVGEKTRQMQEWGPLLVLSSSESLHVLSHYTGRALRNIRLKSSVTAIGADEAGLYVATLDKRLQVYSMA